SRTSDHVTLGSIMEISTLLLKLIKHDHERTEQQNKKLHRHFHHSVEKQSQATLLQRTPRQITLHLRLIRPEIGKREKEAANQARPKSVALVRLKRKMDRLQFSKFAGHG